MPGRAPARPAMAQLYALRRRVSIPKCHQKEKGPEIIPGPRRLRLWQERQDSNPRPLVLETSALAKLSYAPACCPL